MPSKFWRIQTIRQTAAYPAICEVEMFNASAPATNLCVGGVASAESEFSATWAAGKAFDGIKTGDTGWSAATSFSRAWLQYEFPNEVEVDIVDITNRSGSTSTQTTPLEFLVQYFDETSGAWKNKYHHITTSWPSTNTTRRFEGSALPLPMPCVFASPNIVNPVESSFRPDLKVAYMIPYDYVNYKGEGIISGVVKEKGVPIQANMALVHPETNQIVKRIRTNSLGEYEFSGIRDDFTYDVIAQDEAKVWEKKVSSNRKPYTNPLFDSAAFDGATLGIIVDTAPLLQMYRYYRVNITQNNGHGSYTTIAELYLLNEDVDQVHIGGVASASSEANSSNQPSYAFDRDPVSKWTSSTTTGWLQYDMGSIIGISRVGIMGVYQGAGQEPMAPRNFTIEGSTNGSTWVQLLNVVDQINWAPGEVRYFNLT